MERILNLTWNESALMVPAWFIRLWLVAASKKHGLLVHMLGDPRTAAELRSLHKSKWYRFKSTIAK